MNDLITQRLSRHALSSIIAYHRADSSRRRQLKIPSAVCFMLILVATGIIDAAYVAHGNYSGTQLWCPVIDGCSAVINSPYARVFGVPMSYFGFIYYVFMFGLAARLAYEPAANSVRFRAVLYAALGAISSAYFIRARKCGHYAIGERS